MCLTNKVDDTSVDYLIIKKFMLFFLILSIGLLSLGFPIYKQYESNLEKQLLAQEETSVVSAKQMIQKEIYEQLHLLDMIVQSDILKEYLAEGTKEQQARLESNLKNISASFHRFDQIRILDNSGQEKIRVNLVEGKSLVIAKEELQDKAETYYFKATQIMPAGQIYVSAMDLNVEHGVIALPHQPTLRFATPLQDKQGKRKGVLVINYSAKGMLEHFRHLMTQRIDQQGMLLDSQGYWLSNHKRSNEWGADLGKPDHNFANLYPNAWPKVTANESGLLNTPEGVFRYQSIEPLNLLDNQPAHFRIDHHPLISEESFANTNWKLVIFVPRELINSHSFLYQPLGQILAAIFILFLAVIALLGASITVQQKIRKQKDQQQLAILAHQACIDALTGTNNRRNFYELGAKEFKQAQRQQTPLAALMLDADYFKKVNDTYGHAVGDLVLIDLAQTLISTLREVDLLGRVGGEEFAVLLPHTALDKALEVAERLREALAARKVPLPEGGTLSFTVSIGLAMLTPEDKNLDKLFQKADLALYQAKEQGRNRVIGYQEETAQLSHK